MSSNCGQPSASDEIFVRSLLVKTKELLSQRLQHLAHQDIGLEVARKVAPGATSHADLADLIRESTAEHLRKVEALIVTLDRPEQAEAVPALDIVLADQREVLSGNKAIGIVSAGLGSAVDEALGQLLQDLLLEAVEELSSWERLLAELSAEGTVSEASEINAVITAGCDWSVLNSLEALGECSASPDPPVSVAQAVGCLKANIEWLQQAVRSACDEGDLSDDRAECLTCVIKSHLSGAARLVEDCGIAGITGRVGELVARYQIPDFETAIATVDSERITLSDSKEKEPE